MRVLIVISLIALFLGLKAQQLPDTSFKIPITQPAFAKEKAPVIFIDGAHHNFHQKSTGFLPLTLLLEKEGYIVKSTNQKITDTEQLKSCDILVIANALNASNAADWNAPNPSAFTKGEIKIINRWVKKGGQLLLIADHMPFGGAVKELAASFGIEWQNSFVGSQGRVWPPNTFRKHTGTLKALPSKIELHPVDSVATFTGSAFKLPRKGLPVFVLTDADTALLTDSAWKFAHAEKLPLNGFVQGGLLNYGKGTIAAFGEAAMFTAQVVNGNYKVGFNSPDAPQNLNFIRNVFYVLAEPKIEDIKAFNKNLKKKP